MITVLANFFPMEDTLFPLKYDCGTKCYIPPEVFMNFYGNKSDVWSLGVCLYSMLTNSSLYEDIDDYFASEQYKSLHVNNFYIADVPEFVNELIGDMLQRSPPQKKNLHKKCNRRIKKFNLHAVKNFCLKNI